MYLVTETSQHSCKFLWIKASDKCHKCNTHTPLRVPSCYKNVALVIYTGLSGYLFLFCGVVSLDSIVDCSGGVFTEPEGVLSSPGYPNAAPLGVTCLYSISVQPGFQISLNFSDNFHIEQIDAQGPSCLFHWLQVPHYYTVFQSTFILHAL